MSKSLARVLRKGCCALPLALAPHVALAQDADNALFDRGEQIFASECAACHQPEGEGMAPDFPALRDNAELEDIHRIVSRVHLGQGAMPAFPELAAEDIAAVATYVRNAWGNDFGGVTPEEVEAELETLEEREGAASVWDGVFTGEQADRGETVYASACALCHGRRLDGAAADPDMRASPPLARAPFVREWEGRSVAALFGYTRTTMPQHNPGSLSDQEYADVVAYILAYNEMPPGESELEADLDALADIMIEAARD